MRRNKPIVIRMWYRAQRVNEEDDLVNYFFSMDQIKQAK